MTVSATAAVAMLVVVSTTVATAVAAFAITMMMPTTVTTACQHLDGLVDLFLRGIAILADSTGEVKGFASQGVVGVDGDTIFLNLYDSGHELMILAVG